MGACCKPPPTSLGLEAEPPVGFKGNAPGQTFMAFTTLKQKHINTSNRQYQFKTALNAE